jgi:hypothetical protein
LPGNRDKPISGTEPVLEVATSKRGFYVRIGAVLISLDRQSTEDLMFLLAEALEAGDPLGELSDRVN